MKISSSESLLLKEGSPVTPDFTIYTGAMEVDPERENVVRMIGSSTEQDLHGDTMALSALTDMSQVEPGLLIWLNHWYNLPGSLFGSLLEKPELRLKDGIADLHIASDVETTNPDAVQTYGYIKKGRRVGCSIGCIILEAEVDKDNDDDDWWWPPLIILHVRTLEWSIVGIPANQRCWPETAGKGLFNRMLSEGRGDEALALAPMVKGLYPKAFQERLKSIDNEALRRDLERIDVKGNPKSRIEWVPNERTFVMNQKGAYKPLERQDIPAFLAKSKEVPHFAKPTKSLAWDPASDEPILVASGIVPSEIYEKGASGKTSWPLADEDTTWDASAVHKRIMEWAGGDDPDWGKVKTVHFWFDDEKADTWGGYKLPFADVIDGSVKAVPKGIYAAAGAIQGARGGVDIPDSDVPAVKKKIETYYHKLGKKAPWEEDDEDKEEAMEPEKETNVEPDTVEKENLTTSNGSGKWNFLEANQLLDVQLFNALAERLGQTQITLDANGQIQASKAFSELTPEAIQEAIAKTLNFVEVTKGGSEFSKENREQLQSLHDGLVEMCMSSFHPCKEMKSDAEDAENGDDKKLDDEEEDDDKKSFALSIESVKAEIGALIDTLKSQGHFFDPKAFKDLQGKIDAAERRLKDIQSQAKHAEEQLAVLKNVPLGQPTLLRRGIASGEGVATYQDFKQLSAPTAINDNERRWSLEEALKSTTIVPKTVAGEEMLYRLWTDGVGGSVKDGVRPPLTGRQRSYMHPGDQSAYTDGEEAAVPCYDDPGGQEM